MIEIELSAGQWKLAKRWALILGILALQLAGPALVVRSCYR